MRSLYLLLFALVVACSPQGRPISDLIPLATTETDSSVSVSFTSNSVEYAKYYVDGVFKHQENIDPFDFALQKADYGPGSHHIRIDIGVAILGVTTPTERGVDFAVGTTAQASDLSPPLRGAFYYPWYPETWSVGGKYVFYQPTLGYYSSIDQVVVDAHIQALDYAKVNVAIASWFGQGTHYEQNRIPLLLNRTAALGSPLKWALYYEKGNKPQAEVEADLAYIKANYAETPGYAHIGGKPVLFVYNSGSSTCSVTTNFATATKGEWYVSLKVFPNYTTCPDQPAAWHQYSPAYAAKQQKGYAYYISPGFWRADETQPRLARDLTRFQGNVRDMVASGEPWQLITTFNEWGEGTAIESATEWGSSYLDALHNDGVAVAPPPATASKTIVAAGDIACDPTSGYFNGGAGDARNCHQKATSDLVLQANPDAVLTLGDNQYESNTLSQYMGSYDLSWGRVKSKTYPGIGNHEYLTAGAAGYFDYFGTAAGARDKAYYSFDVGAWHIVALNSNCSKVGGCSVGTPQYNWLKADLAANPTKCTLAFFHHPRYSSGQHGDTASMEAIWQALADAKADVVLSGHDHDYERFAPDRGITQFVVGTGGKNHYAVPNNPVRGVVRNEDAYGVLKLTLNDASYAWEFLPEPGKNFTDSGTASCN